MDTRSESQIIELRHDKFGAAFFFLVLFHVWGWGGLIVALISVLGQTLSTEVGVGTSAYVTMGLTFWIGGMLLLGLSSILYGQSYVACYISPTGNPEYPETLKGFPYRRNPDGSVVALTGIGPRNYKSWNEFWKAIRGERAR